MDQTTNAAKTYRLFWTNAAGRIDAVAEAVSAVDDEDAIRLARAKSDSRTVEVWDGSRCVAMLNGAERPQHSGS